MANTNPTNSSSEAPNTDPWASLREEVGLIRVDAVQAFLTVQMSVANTNARLDRVEALVRETNRRFSQQMSVLERIERSLVESGSRDAMRLQQNNNIHTKVSAITDWMDTLEVLRKADTRDRR